MSSPSPTCAGAPPRHPRHWPTWVAVAAMALAARLPWPLQRALGGVLFGIAALVTAYRGISRLEAAAQAAARPSLA